ncbi:hypothetical protein H4R20_003671 [Coemansia guatemalensis]|uniref:Uncharacterized protein n=1 Tax=Coemansia guatemalensis TaxID=2761395 RepID=A0A9W8LSG3_9FUNG|nr:hypothetical protein H4R20_003671 [Coemansia guatemalensis]
MGIPVHQDPSDIDETSPSGMQTDPITTTMTGNQERSPCNVATETYYDYAEELDSDQRDTDNTVLGILRNDNPDLKDDK